MLFTPWWRFVSSTLVIGSKFKKRDSSCRCLWLVRADAASYWWVTLDWSEQKRDLPGRCLWLVRAEVWLTSTMLMIGPSRCVTHQYDAASYWWVTLDWSEQKRDLPGRCLWLVRAEVWLTRTMPMIGPSRCVTHQYDAASYWWDHTWLVRAEVWLTSTMPMIGPSRSVTHQDDAYDWSEQKPNMFPSYPTPANTCSFVDKPCVKINSNLWE